MEFSISSSSIPATFLAFLLYSSTAEFVGESAINVVPAFPVQTAAETCRLDLSDELFGGVRQACGRTKTLDRSRCCPVLAAWLFAAHARSALQVAAAPEADPAGEERPMMPDDSQKCVGSLQRSLRSRGIDLAWPNATCDPIMCFCGIRLHEIGSLSCPAGFNVTLKNQTMAAPTAAVRRLENSCRNPSHAGCTKCLGALDKLKARDGNGDRGGQMGNEDCQVMGLTWLLVRNKTAYIPTVSAALRALMYGAHPRLRSACRCSPDQENMPLAVDSLAFENAESSSASPPPPLFPFSVFPILPLAFFV